MKNIKYKTLTILEKDYQKAKIVSDKRHLTLTKLFSILVAYMEQNENILFPELFVENNNETEEVLTEKILRKIITERINALIGFIKKQDEFLLDIQQDVRKGTKQVLHKIIPIEEQEFSEYNPLFDEYENVISTLKNLLNKKGIKSDEIDLEIQKELGEHSLKNYKESEERIRIKNFLQ